MKAPFKNLSKKSIEFLSELNRIGSHELDMSSTLPMYETSYCDTIQDLLHTLNNTIKNNQCPDEIKMLQYIYVYASITDLYTNFFDELDEQLDGKVSDCFVDDTWMTRTRRH